MEKESKYELEKLKKELNEKNKKISEMNSVKKRLDFLF